MIALFQIMDYSADAGLTVLKIFSPKGDLLRSFQNRQFLVADDMSELEVVNALSQLAQQELEIAYPAPVPNPPVMAGMVGKSYG